MTECVDEQSATSASNPPQAKLPRFRSVQELCDLDASPRMRTGASLNSLNKSIVGYDRPPSSFLRFRGKLGHSKRTHNALSSENAAVVRSRSGTLPSDKENVREEQLTHNSSSSSVKSKKYHSKVIRHAT